MRYDNPKNYEFIANKEFKNKSVIANWGNKREY